MTPERFEQLAEAWGADLRRWPASERAAAQALLAHDAGARTLLSRAGELDALLDTHAVAAPDAWLVQAVLAGAPSRQGRSPKRSPSAGRNGPGGWHLPRSWWWSGAGVAGVGLAGSVFGAIAVATALSAGSAGSAIRPAPVSSALDGAWAATVFDAGTAVNGSEE